MPLYNSEQFVGQAIDSILNQTFTDFELLIIDDGSTDRSCEIVKKYSDGRIRLLYNEQNMGVASTLNKGIKLAKGKYIARMDADDISVINRLEQQVSYLDSNQEYIMCGGSIQYINKNGRRGKRIYYPTEHDTIKFLLFFENAFAHPTIMFRRKAFLKNSYFYNVDQKAEDYDLWCRVVEGKMCNLKNKLLYYRIHNNNTTYNLEYQLNKSVVLIQKKYWKLNELCFLYSHPIEKQIESLTELGLIYDQLNDIYSHSKMTEEIKKYFTKLYFIIYSNYIYYHKNNKHAFEILIKNYKKTIKKVFYFKIIFGVFVINLYAIIAHLLNYLKKVD